ncbi:MULTISPECIES: aldehyde dehydrogenase (NADP(+)) [unclassified Parafrankia]|uniref:aldehyde dehydrogenase (NADP(+)) n=1 Tax=unclassified Parafrankia TaxID=2994368 RepID=UPI000DD380C6|nr:MULTISPECIES: aldehyde dehydrogenase (NADP(+)) [unclassified Parafrankia]TCJ37733.1 aldehyde dehydrogenase (NADP(+)) [Parafrankia sp. BMG5.11]
MAVHTVTTDTEALLAAAAAARPFGALAPAARASMLRAVADALDAAAETLVPVAMRETRLPEPRLRGELVRTTFQLRLFAGLLDDGRYLEATIDPPDPAWPTGPRPDLRRMLIPVGPVLVFAASNFPFAFSVAGGDTAAALAAGCPVLLKAHPGHPELSRLTAAVVTAALAAAGAPAGTLALIEGDEPARAALVDPRVRAGAFTGSEHAGRLLFNLAAARDEPIPFYAEMGSVNPVFVTEAAAARRGPEIWAGYVESYTLGTGQFCTKPGLLFAPAGSAEADLVRLVSARPATPLLGERIAAGYRDTLGGLTGHPAVRVLAAGAGTTTGVTPTLLATGVADWLRDPGTLAVECFGPTSLLVAYDDPADLLAVARALGGQLTATVHGEDTDGVLAADLLAELRERAGRVLWNGWPTGVSVSPAMTHGGPYPATTSLHTSVGTTSISRFLRPVTYQSLPERLLPEPLRDDNPWGIPQNRHGG